MKNQSNQRGERFARQKRGAAAGRQVGLAQIGALFVLSIFSAGFAPASPSVCPIAICAAETNEDAGLFITAGCRDLKDATGPCMPRLPEAFVGDTRPRPKDLRAVFQSLRPHNFVLAGALLPSVGIWSRLKFRPEISIRRVGFAEPISDQWQISCIKSAVGQWGRNKVQHSGFLFANGWTVPYVPVEENHINRIANFYVSVIDFRRFESHPSAISADGLPSHFLPLEKSDDGVANAEKYPYGLKAVFSRRVFPYLVPIAGIVAMIFGFVCLLAGMADRNLSLYVFLVGIALSACGLWIILPRLADLWI
jgi:hypothetical protein